MRRGALGTPFSWFESRWRLRPLSLALIAALFAWGCGMGVTELPSSTQPGGPGFLSITTQQLNDGVQGVSYSTVINTSGGSGRLISCTVTSGTLPTGLSFPEASGSTCVLTTNGQPVTGAAGRYTFTIEAGDSSTPQRTDSRVYSMTIRPQFTINSPVVLDGIAGRSYTRTFTVTTNLVNHAGNAIIGSNEAGNGPITQCVIAGLPAGFAAAGGASSCAANSTGVGVSIVMKAPPGALAAGIYPFTISVTDSPIRAAGQAGVVAPASTTTIQPSLVVRQEFSVTQGALAEGVQGRTYGANPLAQDVGTNTAPAAPAINSGESAEFGDGPLTSCAVVVSPGGAPLTAEVNPANKSSCLIESAAPVSAAGTYTVTISATDSPITDPASPGAVVVPANTRSEQLTWTVAPPISYSLNFDSGQGQPGAVPAAVENRPYGSAPKSPLVLTATGGLSASDGLSIVVSGTVPAGIVCATPQPNPQPPGLTAQLTCTSSGNPVSATPGTASFAVTVSDAGNSATPPGSISNDALGHTSHSLTVEPPLSLAVNLTDPLPPGVSGRPYGAAPSHPLIYTAAGGLGGYSFTTPAPLSSPGAAFPAGIGCAQGSGSSADTFSCSAASITATGSATVSYGPVPVTVDDTSNATTPDGASSATTATQNRTLPIEPPLSITPLAVIDPPPPGVQGRTYGSGAGFTPLTYVIAGGDPPYTNYVFPASIGSAGSGVPTPIACANTLAGTSSEVVCSSNSAPVTAAPGTYSFTFSVSDSGSGETAPTTISLPARTITINAPLAWTAANPTSSAPPNGVENRSYGDAAAGFTPLTYNATGGIGTYSFTLPSAAGSPGANNTPAGINCAASSGTQVVCTSGASPVSGTPGGYSFGITVNDTANATTPGSATSGTAKTVTEALTIEPPLAFSPTSQSLTNPAVLGRAYGEGAGCSGGGCVPFDYTLSGGLSGYQSTISSTNGIACALQADGKTYQCSSTSISGSAGTAALNFSATDTANASTPSGQASGTQATATASLPINAAMTITPPASLAPAVTGRTYGSGSSCSGGTCTPIVFNIQGGLGGYSSTATPAGFPGAFSCAFGSAGVLSGTYSCSNSAGVTGSGTASLTISASDTANASTPTVTATSSPAASLTIYPDITVTGPGSLAPAVSGRPYGSGMDCGAAGTSRCTPITYSVQGGLGGYSSAPALDDYPSGLACGAPVNGPTGANGPTASYTCLSSSGISGAAGSYTAGISVADTANASTPAIIAAKASNTAALAVDSPLSLALTSGAPPDAVDQRAYGTGSGCSGSGGICAPIVFTVSGGLGNGNYTSSATITPSIGFACALSGSTNYDCSATNVTVPSPTTETLTVTASDIGNASTPSGTGSSTSASANASLTVEPQFKLAAASPASWSTTAVYQSPFGETSDTCGGSACKPLVYNASGGLALYQPNPTVTGSNATVTNAGVTCTLSGTQYLCASNSVPSPGSTPATTTLTVTATDGSNASAPTQTASDGSVTLTVNPALGMSITPSPLTNSPAVTNRSYGTGSGCGPAGAAACAPIEFTATGGTVEGSGSNYAYAVSPANALSSVGFTCAASGTNKENYSCSSSSVTATSAISLSTVSVDDVANASVPASSPVSLGPATSLPVDAPLSIPSSPVPNNALLGYQNSSFFTLPAANGLSSLGIASWSVYTPAAPTSPCPSNKSSVLNGFKLTATTGVIGGTPSTAGPANFDACATDVANGSTPAGTASSAHPPDYDFTVVNPYAYLIDPGTAAVDVISTGAGATGTPSNPNVSVTGLTLTSPLGIAVTQDGLEAVGIVNTNQLAIIDTTTNTAAAKSPFSLASGNTCTSAKGIAIHGTTGYLLCDNGASASDVYVLPLAGLTSASGSTITPTSSISLAASVVPVAIAMSSDGSTLVVAEATTTPGLQIIKTSNSALSPLVTLSAGTTPVAVVTALNGSNVYAYIAETEASNPGQVDVVSINTATFAGTLLSPVTFKPVSTTNPEPTCIAVTPDNARVYVGLADTDQISVFVNASSPGGPATAYAFPALTSATAGTLTPAGVAVPPLNPTLSAGGFRIFVTTTGTAKDDVYIFDDSTSGVPTADPASPLLFTSASATPKGIAAIPVPAAP